MPRGLPSGDTREGFALHLDWERALFDARYAVVSWPEAYGGRDASPMEWLIFEEEYYRAGGPQRVTQNGIFLLAPTVFEFGTEAQKDHILPRMAPGRRPVVPGLVGAERGSRPRRHPEPRRPRRSRRRLAADRPEDLDDPRRVLHAPVRAVPQRPRRRAPPRASPTSSCRSTPRASRCAASAGSTATRGSPRCSSTTCSSPDDAVLGGVRRGLVGRDGHHERRARPHPAQPGPLPRRGRPARASSTATTRRRPTRTSGDAVVARTIDAEAYRWQTFLTVTRMTDGENVGAESSLTKVFWSELDVRIHETALALLGANAEVDDGGTASTQRVDEGLSVRAVGPDLRGDERDPAQRHRRARARPAAALSRSRERRRPMRFAFTDDQLAFRDAVRDLLANECPPSRGARGVGERRRPQRRGLARARGDGRARRARARGRRAGSGSPSSTWC